MDDIFLEKIVAQRKSNQDWLKIGGALVLALVLVFVAFQLGSIIDILTPAIILATGYGLWYVVSTTSREFEYSVTNGEVDIDMILSRRKRQRVFSAAAKNFELMAKTNSDEFRQIQKGRYKILDCSARPDSPDNWFILAEYKGQRLMVVFAPDERMLKHLRRYNPSKIRYTEYGN
jgi:hypothetical protein